MDGTIEISWYGKAGNGVITASAAMAYVLATEGRYVQSMVEYSLQRKGFPVRAFNRIADNPIRNHSYVVQPDLVAVTDASMFLQTDMLIEQRDDAVFFVNSANDPSHIRKMVDLRDRSLHVLDADKISIEGLGFVMPGVPMLSLMIKHLDIISSVAFKERLREFLSGKFSREVIDKNLAIIDRSFSEEAVE